VPTLNFFLGILRQALLKSGSLFYIDYVKKNIKKKKIPYLPTLFLFDVKQNALKIINFLYVSQSEARAVILGF